MKTKFNIRLFLVAISLTSIVQAQEVDSGGVGNGGWAVVCRERGKIIKAELLDIYEGRELYQRKYSNDLDMDSRIELMKKNLNQVIKYMFESEYTKINENTSFVEAGSALLETDDAKPYIRITKKGCNFEQVANYTDAGDVFIAKEIYEKFNDLNKAALFVHEAFYAIYRQRNSDQPVLNSRDSRKLTAHLLSKNVDSNVIQMLLEKHVYEGALQSCGTVGTIDEAIADCNSSIGNFSLVTRNFGGAKIFKDMKSGLLWGDSNDEEVNYYTPACNYSYMFKSWGLPTRAEIVEAVKNGIGDAIPSMNRVGYWTSDVVETADIYALKTGYVYSGPAGKFYLIDLLNPLAAHRCVGR